MKSADVTINNVSVRYSIKPVINPVFSVLFIHGFPFDRSMWDEQMESLPDTVQGLAYDVRGHGESEIGHGFLNMNLLASDLIEFIKALNLKNVIVCGISMGGYIILRAAQLDPKIFSGMILCDTTSFADTDDSKLNRFSAIDLLQNDGKESYTNSSVKKLFSGKSFNTNKTAIDRIKSSMIKNPVNTICSTLLALASRTDTTEVLGKIKVPVLIIRGEEDQLIKPEQAEDLNLKIPGSEMITVPDSGHLPNLENPEVFNKALNAFLKKNFLQMV